jgi:hypothetical protein
VGSAEASAPGGAAAKPALSRGRKIAFAAAFVGGVLALAEVAARLLRAPLHFASYRLLRIDQVHRGYPAVRDPVLGYAPKPGFASTDNHWGTRVSIDADGLRSNGSPRPAGPPVLAVGDSFTFGDQVDDDQTWPAHLERVLQRPVLNGGVFGYSFAQAILRAEGMLERYADADWLLVSFIPDDITRCELSKRYTPVPCFDVVDGQLALRPLAEPVLTPEEARQRSLKNLLGYSALLDAVLANTMSRWWITDEKDVWALPRGMGEQVAVLLVDRIAAAARARGSKLLFLLQGPETTPAAEAVLARARACGALTLDLTQRLAAEAKADPALEGRLFAGHMTPAGNRWVAEHLAAAMRRAE